MCSLYTSIYPIIPLLTDMGGIRFLQTLQDERAVTLRYSSLCQSIWAISRWANGA
jgi:hypothetical protein